MPRRNASSRIHVVLGFHVNYNHSYRGDRNDASGFGYDTTIIRSIVDTMDEAALRGLDARGTWDFDNFWSAQNCMPLTARGLLDAIGRRVRSKIDEAILDNWNNGLAACMTRDELRLSIMRAISNEWGSGVKDMFGTYSPVVRPQECMFTHGNIEAYAEQGIKAMCLYYSAVPFDAFRNFVPRLTPQERYNPLLLKSPVSDAEILVIPTYNQGDVLDNLSLANWLRKIRAHQLSGRIKGDALLYINMDADAVLWKGVDLPGPASKLPNVRGLIEYIETVNELPYARFGTLGEYIDSHGPAGEVRIDMDTADGTHTGYASWSEKWINYPLWTLHQKARRHERMANALLRAGVAPEQVAERARKMLYGDGLSNIECRLLTTSTTHFGLANPMMNPERLRVAFHFADEACRKGRSALDALLSEVPMRDECAEEPKKDEKQREWQDIEFLLVCHNKYENAPACAANAPVSVVVDAPAEMLRKPLKLRLIGPGGVEVPFDAVKGSVANATTATMLRFVPATADSVQRYRFARRAVTTTAGYVRSDAGLLSNGLVTARLDASGRVYSLVWRGVESASAPLFNPGVTYRSGGRDTWYGPASFEVDAASDDLKGICGKYAALRLTYSFGLGHAVDVSGEPAVVRGSLVLSVMEGVPCLFVDGVMELPETPCTSDYIGVGSHVGTRFDPCWREVMPLHIRPGIVPPPGNKLRIWKHNYLDVAHAYELNFGDIDRANRNIDSLNTHVTDGWVAVGDGARGLLLAHDQTVNSAPAMCPVRVREDAGGQRIMLNPFGTYTGRQLSHLPDGSGAARDLMIAAVPGLQSPAPSFNGKRVAFSVMLAPYAGDAPPGALQRDASAYSMPPAAFVHDGDGRRFARGQADFYSTTKQFDHRMEFGLSETAGWTYEDFLKAAAASSAPDAVKEDFLSSASKVPPRAVAGLAVDAIKALLKI